MRSQIKYLLLANGDGEEHTHTYQDGRHTNTLAHEKIRLTAIAIQKHKKH